ncbi:hypothetical protein B1R38_27020 [Bacillus cereus]|uniref:hypothetical protein n=1 Tax=Bacillus cereus TaxID=1396 RepID=UPI000D64CE25|nr:hypothetical protein [Bacillus cereus]PWE70241.1 hypothetical protein B1R38_27020 [Bacillus cereus]
MGRYNQYDAVIKTTELLNQYGYEAIRIAKSNVYSDVIVNQGGKQVNLLVRHLEKDHAYKNSPLPYKVFKIEAFDNNEERDLVINKIDFVFGYNFNDKCFACVPIEEFKDRRSTVVHEKEGNRYEYYNSIFALEEYLKCSKKSSL